MATTLTVGAAPVGVEAIKDRYGLAALDRCRSGLVALPAPVRNEKVLRCHAEAAEAIGGFFDLVYEQNLWHCIDEITGPYLNEGRPGVYPPQLLLTAWGAGFKLNERTNRFNQYPPTDMPAQTPTGDAPGQVFFLTHPIVKIAKHLGFTWGGDSPTHPYPCLFEYGRY